MHALSPPTTGTHPNRDQDLRVVDLCVKGSEGFALGPATFSVDKNGRHAILGEAGSGKSLLLLALATLVSPHRGRVAFAGVDVDFTPPSSRTRGLLVAQRRQTIGVAFQRDALLNDQSVIENVALAARGRGHAEPMDRARDTLLSVGIDVERHDVRPNILSGGMRRRVGLARALVSSPTLLFLDDPTAGLDPVTAKDVMDVVGTVTTNATIVIATNDVDLVLPTVDTVTLLGRDGNVTSGRWQTCLDENWSSFRPRAFGGLS